MNTIQPLNPILFEIGSLQIHWYAVLIISGALLALWLSIREGKRVGIKSDLYFDIFLYGFPISILCARIYYVIFKWSYYSKHLNEVFAIWNGGLAIHGAIIGGAIFLIVLCKKRREDTLLVLDTIAPNFILAQAIGRWGNFMNQEAHGGVVPGADLEAQRQFLENMRLPDFIINQMYINGVYYHPTFLYESLWNILGFILLIILRRTKIFYKGDLIASYILWYSFGRFFIEGMRTDSLYAFGTLRTAQVISIALMVGSMLFILIRRLNKNKREKRYIDYLQSEFFI